MGILIRELTEDQIKALDLVKDKYQEKTNSKAVMAFLNNFEDRENEHKRMQAEYREMKRRNNKLEETFKQIKWNLDVLGDDEDDSEFY
jgi:predicted  nucleic acid-binding Zn-ribbon protein